VTTAIQTLIASIFTLAEKQDAQLRAIVAKLFTPEVLVDKKAYKANRDAMQVFAIENRKMAPDSARTYVYRLLQRAGVEAPGKNAGDANGKAKAGDAKQAEAEAIVAVGQANTEKHLLIAFRAKDWSGVRRIVDAAQAADKAAKTAKSEPEVATV
jgi:D-serine deaminase-like pyridoxal phosphate-dependent protein